MCIIKHQREFYLFIFLTKITSYHHWITLSCHITQARTKPSPTKPKVSPQTQNVFVLCIKDRLHFHEEKNPLMALMVEKRDDDINPT